MATAHNRLIMLIIILALGGITLAGIAALSESGDTQTLTEPSVFPSSTPNHAATQQMQTNSAANTQFFVQWQETNAALTQAQIATEQFVEIINYEYEGTQRAHDETATQYYVNRTATMEATLDVSTIIDTSDGNGKCTSYAIRLEQNPRGSYQPGFVLVWMVYVQQPNGVIFRIGRQSEGQYQGDDLPQMTPVHDGFTLNYSGRYDCVVGAIAG